MLIFIPILLLLIFAVVIGYFGRYRWSVGTSWLITAGSVLSVWIFMIVLRVRLPQEVQITDWSPLQAGAQVLIFNLSAKTWLFSFLLVSLLSGVILTDTVRLGQGNNLSTWTGAMVLTAMGLFSIYSQTLLAVILTWTLIDVVEFGLLFRVINHSKVHEAAIQEFSTRIIGTILIMCGMVFSKSTATIAEHSQYANVIYLLILFGTTFRLGVFPLHVPLTANLPIRRSLGTLLRFVAPLSALSFLVQVPSQFDYATINNILFFLALITALFGAISWASSKNELIGRPFWMLSFCGLIIISFVRGQTEAVIALSINMAVYGGVLFFSSYSSRIVNVLGGVCLLSMIGIPFTSSAPIWFGLLDENGLLNIITMIPIFLLGLGFLRHINRVREQKKSREPWMLLFYFTGLIFLAVIPFITIIWRFQDVSQRFDLVPPVILLVGIAVFYGIFHSKFGKVLLEQPGIQKLMHSAKNVGAFASGFSKFDWFFGLIQRIFAVFEKPLHFFIRILEGDGGFLWGLLILALIASIMIGKMVP